MSHTFLIEGGAATMTSHPQPDGSRIEIACKNDAGEDVRLQLIFSAEGMQRFREMLDGFASVAAGATSGSGRTPAAEPTSGTAAALSNKHIERYTVSLMSEDEVNRAMEAIRTYTAGGAKSQEKAAEFDGQSRIVAWRVPDSRADGNGSRGYRVYLSEGALRAARAEGVEIRTEGEVSRKEVPQGRELLVGDPPMDWQDTTL